MEILQNILRTKIGHTHTHLMVLLITRFVISYLGRFENMCQTKLGGENTYNECKSNYRENQSFSVESSKGQNW